MKIGPRDWDRSSVDWGAVNKRRPPAQCPMCGAFIEMGPRGKCRRCGTEWSNEPKYAAELRRIK